MSRLICSLFLIVPLVFLFSCSFENLQEKSKTKVEWTFRDNPDLLSPEMKYLFEDLPLEGEAERIPWAGNYWPTYKDTINFQWDGDESLSPTEKYERAFSKDNIADLVSVDYGIDGLFSKKCTENDQCDLKKGEICAKRRDMEEGRCAEAWFGICHAWAPAAIMEPEPVKSVIVDDTEFKVNDIKALVTYAYNKGLSTKFLSMRCNEKRKKIEYDEFGRPLNEKCIDTNAGTFHVVVTNLLGLQKRSFIEDRTFDYEVWNQPVRGYRVVLNEEISSEVANSLIGVVGEVRYHDTKSDMAKNQEWKVMGSFDVHPGETVIATLKEKKYTSENGTEETGDTDLYVAFNEEATYQKYACRSAKSGTDESCKATVPKDASKVFISIIGYSSQSSFDVETKIAAPKTEYGFNDKAETFRHMRMILKYISESEQERDGNLSNMIDLYTQSDYYDYILEIDAKGKIVGGEWIGYSQNNHPDFLWLPVSKGAQTVSGIDWADVKELLRKSTEEEVLIENLEISLTKNEWKEIGPFEVGEGVSDIIMWGGGDVDLYVKKGSAPTKEDFDCRPFFPHSYEGCKVNDKGKVFISLFGYGKKSDIKIRILYN